MTFAIKYATKEPRTIEDEFEDMTPADWDVFGNAVYAQFPTKEAAQRRVAKYARKTGIPEEEFTVVEVIVKGDCVRGEVE